MKKLIVLFLMCVVVAGATVSDSEAIRQSFTTNGSTTTFTFTFKCNSSDDVFVYSPVIATGLPIAALVEDTDYTIAPTGGSYLNGGVVTISPALADTVALIIVRRIKQSQETAQGAITPTSIVAALDKLTRQDQDAEDRKDRSLHIPESDPVAFDMTLPNAVDRAGKVLVFDESGNIGVMTGADTFTVVNGTYESITVSGDVSIVGTATIGDIELKGPYVDVRAFGAIADSGTTDNKAAFDLAIATGKNVFIPFVPSQYYKILDEITVANAGQVIFSNGADVRQATPNKRAFILTASNTEIRGLKIVGHSFDAASGNNEKGIDVFGADKDNYLAGIKIVSCDISNFGDYGVHFEFVEDFEITGNLIDDIFHAGIQVLQVRRGTINNNVITDIVGTAAAYGIVLSRQAGTSLVTFPRCSEITISNNVVRNVTNWEGIDVHSGENIAIVGNTVEGCTAGIVATATDDDSADPVIASLNITISGNVVDSGVTDGSSGFGIQHAGGTVNGTAIAEYGTGCITGNTVIGHGDNSSANSGGIGIQATNGMTVTGNSIVGCTPNAILVRYLNESFCVSGNAIIDPWSDTLDGIGVLVKQTLNAGYVGGNSMRIVDTGLGVTVLSKAVEVLNVANNIVELGQNHSEAATYISDPGQKALRGTYVTTNTINTAVTADLNSTTLIANSLGIGRFLRITAAGTLTGANGNATINLVFGTGGGAVTISFRPVAASATEDWVFNAIVEYSSAGAQRIAWTSVSGSTALAGYDTATVDLTADMTIKCTGTLSSGSDVMTQNVWNMERY